MLPVGGAAPEKERENRDLLVDILCRVLIQLWAAQAWFRKKTKQKKKTLLQPF